MRRWFSSNIFIVVFFFVNSGFVSLLLFQYGLLIPDLHLWQRYYIFYSGIVFDRRILDIILLLFCTQYIYFIFRSINIPNNRINSLVTGGDIFVCRIIITKYKNMHCWMIKKIVQYQLNMQILKFKYLKLKLNIPIHIISLEQNCYIVHN